MPAPSHPAADCTAEECALCARLNSCQLCFEELLRRFQSPLLHFLIRRLGSRHDAEDLVQETFLRAFGNLNQYRNSCKFSTWLLTIANRLLISKWRKRQIRTECGDQMLESAGGIDPADRAIWSAVRAVLDDDAFTAVWLSYVESMPADEIGLVLGRNANAVRILLHRARNRLAKRLGSTEDFSGVVS
jgi:RNA polymerase sigma-70 factor (ECF subfamily)